MLLTIVAFFIVLGLLVLVHEAGHFFVSRRFGVRVEEFGFGLPPRVLGIQRLTSKKIEVVSQKEEIELDVSQNQPVPGVEVIKETVVDTIKEVDRVTAIKKWHWVWGRKKIVDSAEAQAGTIYSLNLIPLGGFVKIKGEEGQSAEDSDSFGHQNVWKRILIISAGVAMNLVLAAVLLGIGLSIGSPQFIDKEKLPELAKIKDERIMVLDVLSQSPAAAAGIKVGDVILSVDGNSFTDISSFQNYISQKTGRKVKISYQSQDQKISKELTPVVLAETGKGGVGIALATAAIVSYPWYIAWWYGILAMFSMVWGVIYSFFLVIKSLLVSHQLIGEVYGPVGIATLVGDAARSGILYLLQFTATLSVIIAVINFLPFPALDGGRVLFLAIEAVRGKPINQKTEAIIHNIGFLLLMLLFVFVTFRDVSRLSSGFAGWWQQLTNLF